jgi:tetratricopeptide (TPR) repeat protein
VVRETCAIAAYQAGRWADALTEFRAARRLTGSASYLPLMADCERALGRLDRALDLVSGQEARAADRATQVELRIVESGVRRDQDLPAAAVVALQIPELTDGRIRPWSARLFYAYADALLDAGRRDEAGEWFAKAAAADVHGETDAVDRHGELEPVEIADLLSEGGTPSEE